MEGSKYYNDLPTDDKAHYHRKLTLTTGVKLPDPFDLTTGWVDDISKLPSITSRDVTEYLIDTPSDFTKESFKAYKSMEAYNYYACGHVHEVYFHQISEESEYCFVKSDVLPSQRQSATAEMNSAWVCIHKEDGSILTANCTCTAGCGSACSHAAALMFKLEALRFLDINEPIASTSKLCQWKKCKRKVTPSPLSQINFKKPKKGDLPLSEEVLSTNAFNYTCREPTEGVDGISKDEFKKLFDIDPKSGIFSSLHKEDFLDSDIGQVFATSETESDNAIETTHIPQPLTSLFDPSCVNMDVKELNEHAQRRFDLFTRTYDQESYDRLNEITERQAKSSSWLVHRAGRITASICAQACKTNPEKPCKSFINTVMQYSDHIDNKYTRYGKNKEDEAVRYFEETQKNLHINLTVRKSGLVVKQEYPFLGASPDAIVNCECHEERVLEVKCPYKYRNGLTGWNKDKNFVLDASGNIKVSHQYYYQMQLQILLCNVKQAEFLIYSPAPGDTSIFKTIDRDEDLLKSLKTKTSTLFFEHILPEIVARMHEEVENDRKLYCICKRPSFGPMVACDHPTCKVEWYHYPCAPITRAPKGKWYCETCRPLVPRNKRFKLES